MISLTAAEINAWVVAFFFPLARILAVLSSAPPFNNPAMTDPRAPRVWPRDHHRHHAGAAADAGHRPGFGSRPAAPRTADADRFRDGLRHAPGLQPRSIWPAA
jgi:hypothetical protein